MIEESEMRYIKERLDALEKIVAILLVDDELKEKIKNLYKESE